MQATPGKGQPSKPGAPRMRPPLAQPGVAGLRVWQKLALIPLALLVPLSILLYFFASSQRNEIAFTTKEVRGVEYLQAVFPILQNIAQHRGMTNSLLSGDRFFAQPRQQKAAELDRNLQALLEVDQKHGVELKTTQRVQTLLQDWQQLKNSATELSAEGAWNAHNRFIEQHLLPLLFEVGDNSSLVLDSALDARFLVDLTINILPALTDDLGRLRDYGSGLVAKGQASVEEKNRLQITLGRVRQLLNESSRALDSAFQASPGIQRDLESRRIGFENGVDESIRIVQAQLLSVARPTIQATDFFRGTSKGIDAAFDLYQASLNQLEQLLHNRINRLQTALYSSLAIALLVLVGTVVLVLWLANQITQPLDHLRAASLQLAQGNFDIQIQHRSNDELGELATALQLAASQLKELIGEQHKEQEKALQLQLKVRQFLDVATELARGDLTKRGEVSSDVLGKVVDAVNLTVEEIVFLLKEVRRAAESVSHNAGQMDQLTASIASGALLQAQEVSQVQNQAQLVAYGIRQMVQSAGVTAQAARQTLESAQLGRQAMTQTLSGMSDIRTEMQVIAESISALAQRSAEIETITKTLEDFASQTNLLALNASFEAAGAGAAGRRFAIVADEIRKLAEVSARETSLVSSLVQQVQSDITRVVGLVNDGVHEVETGYGIATTAGGRLEEIAELVAQSASLAQEISGLAQSQVSVVERVDQAVQKIARTAQQTGNESQEVRQTAEAMRLLAEQLSSSLSRFRLPN